MKMVAASSLRRSQERVIAARPYAATLEATLASVASRVPPKEDGDAAPPAPRHAAGEAGRPDRRLGRQGALRRLQRERQPRRRGVPPRREGARRRGGPARRGRPEGRRLLEAAERPRSSRRAPASSRSSATRRRPASPGPRRTASSRGETDAVYVDLQRVQERHLAGRPDEAAPPDRARPSPARSARRRDRRPRLPLRAGAGGDPRAPRPAPPRVPGLPDPPRVERGRERRADDGDGRRRRRTPAR